MVATRQKKELSKPSRIARRPQSRSERSTTRREAATQRELRRLEKLCVDLREEVESAERSRRETLSIVSHDVRNPLSVILVSAKLLARSIPSESNGRRQLDAIARAADEINHLVQELLDASSIESGGLTVGQEALEIEPLVTKAIQQAQPLAAQKSLRLEAHLADDLPPVLGDSDRIVQVIASLIINAVKFTPKAGSISVRADAVDGEARLSVTDSGPGIPDELRPLVFSRHVHAAVRPLGQGTGLSAFVAKGIVEAHGGRIWVESKVGEGSTFRFSLPVAASHQMAPAAAS